MDVMQYPVYYRRTDDVIQTVEEHFLGVGDLCEDYAKKHGFEWTGRLLRFLHDIDKYTNEFHLYITDGILRYRTVLDFR